ncbi:S-layer homology domain-containing protein [Paenibacillus septentrionalis]
MEEGIMIGKSSSTFDPLSNLTKAEAAVIVIRILESLELD